MFVTGVMHVACFTSSLVFFSVKNIGFGSLSAQRFDDILLDFYTRRWASFLVNFLYQTLLFRFLGFRLILKVIRNRKGSSKADMQDAWRAV